MSTTSAKFFGPGDRLHVQAQRIWLILVAHVMCSDRDPKAPFTITYGEVALAMGYPDARAGHTLGRQLGIIAKFCMDNDLPPLNSVVVSKDHGLPGEHVMLREGKTLKHEQAAVMKQDWFAVRVPTTGTFRTVWETWNSPADDDDDE